MLSNVIPRTKKLIINNFKSIKNDEKNVSYGCTEARIRFTNKKVFFLRTIF